MGLIRFGLRDVEMTSRRTTNRGLRHLYDDVCGLDDFRLWFLHNRRGRGPIVDECFHDGRRMRVSQVIEKKRGTFYAKAGKSHGEGHVKVLNI